MSFLHYHTLFNMLYPTMEILLLQGLILLLIEEKNEFSIP